VTDSTAPGKRERLVLSAAELFGEHGVQRTTIAQIAEHADVPPGNVYYYFKTFDDLVDAVVSRHEANLVENLTRIDKLSSPKAKIKGLAELWSASAEQAAEHGCPMGSLVCELNKSHDARSEHATVLFRLLLDFVETQLRELGQRNPRGLAVSIIARIQGAALLANSFGDPSLLVAEVRRIERDVDALT
jgi:TetR/AcrR family transcriptional repressor of nem operon